MIYPYVPDLSKNYLREDPIIANIDTWRLEEDEARDDDEDADEAGEADAPDVVAAGRGADADPVGVLLVVELPAEARGGLVGAERESS